MGDGIRGTTRHPLRRRTAAAAMGIASALLLAACAASPDHPTATGSGTGAGTPDAAPAAVQAEAPDGLLGSGELLSSDGGTTGRVEISRAGGDLRFRVVDLVTAYEIVGLSVSAEPRGEDPCVDSGGIHLTGEVSSRAPVDAVIPIATFAHGDPTAVDDADLYVAPREGPGGDCSFRSIARATIDWKVSPLRPFLAALVDGGTRSGAHGVVEERADGQRVYVVAPDDLLNAVAARFGITADDVFYLNESRRPTPYDPMLYIDEELNLSLAFR